MGLFGVLIVLSFAYPGLLSLTPFRSVNDTLSDIMKAILITLLLCSFSLFADPWGKDADLCVVNKRSLSMVEPCKTPLLGTFAEKMIGFHQEVISPADGPRSHYLPSSSQYTLEAMRKHGFVQGYFMGCDRLMRENSEAWVYRTKVDASGYSMKLDPVR